MVFKYRVLLIVSPVLVLLDQLTKWLVVHAIPFGERVPVVPGYFDLVHFRNTGAAFGLFADGHANWREPFFIAISLVASVVVLVVVRRLQAHERLMAVVMALIFGGIWGNFLDRLRVGAVTDFLSVHWRDVVVRIPLGAWQVTFPLDWPAFNVADSAITVSMVLLAWQAVKGES